MRVAVIGAGLMGRAAVYDLAQNDSVQSVGLFDTDENLAVEMATKFGYGKASASALDADDETAAAAALKGYDAAISCVPYRYNLNLTKAAIAAGCHLVDLGGNNDMVDAQLQLTAEAEQADVIIVPDCGLAPGMVAVLAADAMTRFDKVESMRIRVGGLPQSPRPPLNYMMLFAAEGLINEYWEPCVIVEEGQKKTVNPMTGVELLEFDGIGKLEAFYTSGGTSTLPDSFLGQIDFLDYKTIRYPGHCALFRPMLEIGLGSRQEIDVNGTAVEPRAVFKAVLNRSLTFDDLDLGLVRLTAEGLIDGESKTRIYEIVDRQESKTALTAMMRLTAFPASIVALMAASGEITQRGVKPQEIVVDPSLFIPHLKARNINLQVTEH
ncbi:MAG: saccharopine dehydrogenase NADP-binding domain-containing protein [candidate division Zixibacteria bacterium]|nr:saccharopine dehydrogenase NADP-binding domain-containing protein [candidate division Zixibacteria bacterium]MDH3937103.1 saccharopine dehydrogenase NADP-binding domain-containing protein [candidate division Zixibacteria bacterium]MDH4033061.1 saccharopine dehydrogenase NADP-binding domain-containing protein [candidate division Zixibacteria bacterium]